MTEKRDFGVTLAEVVQHDELSFHFHANTDGLRGRAVREEIIKTLTLHYFLTRVSQKEILFVLSFSAL